MEPGRPGYAHNNYTPRLYGGRERGRGRHHNNHVHSLCTHTSELSCLVTTGGQASSLLPKLSSLSRSVLPRPHSVSSVPPPPLSVTSLPTSSSWCDVSSPSSSLLPNTRRAEMFAQLHHHSPHTTCHTPLITPPDQPSLFVLSPCPPSEDWVSEQPHSHRPSAAGP